MLKTVRILEGLAAGHRDECPKGDNCEYCSALCDMAAALTADWVASLSPRYVEMPDDETDNPAPLRVVLGGHPLVQLARVVS